MIWLSQLALEGCSIIFPIHEVYNKSTYYSCSPGLGVPPTHPLPDLETHKALPENWQSRSEPGAELPPPPPNEQNRVKLVCCRAGSRVDKEQLQYLSINYTVLSTPPREVTNHKKDTLHWGISSKKRTQFICELLTPGERESLPTPLTWHKQLWINWEFLFINTVQSLFFFFWWLITSLGGCFNGSHNKAIIVFSIITASFASVACLSDASCLCLPGGTLNGAPWAVLRLGTCRVSPTAPSL